MCTWRTQCCRVLYYRWYIPVWMMRQEKLWHCFDAYKLLYTYTEIVLWTVERICICGGGFQHEPQEEHHSTSLRSFHDSCETDGTSAVQELLFMEMTSWAISKILIVLKIILFSDSEQTASLPRCERAATLVCHWAHATWITSCTINSYQAALDINQILFHCIIFWQSIWIIHHNKLFIYYNSSHYNNYASIFI